jgi:hypothetical protein
MSSPVLTRKAPEGGRTSKPRFTRLQKTIAIAIAALLAGTAVLLRTRLWPFEQGPVLQDLAETSDSSIAIRSFHRTYFPAPGCVIDGLVFHHGDPKTPPLITIERLTIRGNYFGILTQHVPLIIAEGMHVFIPPFGTGASFHTQASTIVVDELVARGTVVEFGSHDPQKKGLRFEVHEASLRHVGSKSPMQYRLKVHNPEPPGEIETAGEFGAWRRDNAGETPLSGEYTFDHADLNVYHGIGGILSSQGNFGGVLKHIEISGSTDVPDFEVRSGHHPVHLVTEFSAYVDGTDGDTYLKRVDAHFSRTQVEAQGSIAKIPGRKGKTALIDLRVKQGRIEDVLGLFVKAPRAPMSGPIGLKAKVEIPSGSERFLEKIKLQGAFGIDEGSFTKPQTQAEVNKLSAGARGQDKDDPETVLTDLKGQVRLDHGISTFTELSFGVPGASARLHGTYNIIEHRIDLHGQMQVDTQISKTTTGMKSLLLKIMDPFFKKRHRGEVVPVHLGGTYEHPQYGLDLDKDKKEGQKAKGSSNPKSKNDSSSGTKPNC